MADPAFRNNPWSAEFWNLTAQGAYVKKYGVDLAKTKAREAGVTFGAAHPRVSAYSPLPRDRNFTVIVQRRNVGQQGPIPQGYTGDGPPDEFVADNA